MLVGDQRVVQMARVTVTALAAVTVTTMEQVTETETETVKETEKDPPNLLVYRDPLPLNPIPDLPSPSPPPHHR